MIALKLTSVLVCAVLASIGLELRSKTLEVLGLLGMLVEISLVRLELWFISRPRVCQWMGNTFFPHLRPNNSRRLP